MITATPVALPEPAIAPSASPQKVAPNDDRSAGEFHALLDKQAEPQNDFARLEKRDAAERESAAEIGSAVDTDETGSDDSKDDVKREADAKAADATVLSSQLAMWQILPQPVAPADPNAAKIASPMVAESAIEVADLVTSGAAENISSSGSEGAAENAGSGPEMTGKLANDPGLPGAIASASESPPAKPFPSALGGGAAGHAEAAATPANPLESKVLQEAAEAPSNAHAQANGIPVAKQQRAMSNPEIHPAETPETAVLAGSNASGTSAAPIAPVAAAGGQKFQEQAREEAGGQPDTSFAGTPMLAPEPKSHHTVTSADFPAVVHAADATKVIEQIERATEHLRSQNGQRIEMRLPTQDGGELLVRLQISGGELTAVFRTESAGLRDALQAGWTQYTAANPERELKVGQAVFESPTLQNGMSSHSQTPDQRRREQAFAEADSSQHPAALFPSADKSVRAAHSTPLTTPSAAGLQIYA